MLKKTLLKGSMVLLLLVVLAGCSLPINVIFNNDFNNSTNALTEKIRLAP